MVPLIITPTYNERENLGFLIPSIHAQLPEAHILVVDDNSPDGTGDLADLMSASDERVHPLHRPGKAGLGKAYLAGFEWALARDFDPIFEMDADLSHDPAHLPALLAASKEADLALGSRYIPGGGTENWGLSRRMLSRWGSLYARSILGLEVRDLTGGFKCFNRRVLEALPLEDIKSEGYAFQIDLTYRALQLGFTAKEVPIVFRERRLGESKISRRIVLEAMTMVWRLKLS